MLEIKIPTRRRGRPSLGDEQHYLRQLFEFADAINKINSRLDFKVSSRGWCYILENEAGLLKGDFNKVQSIINDCRKNGLLPMDICAEDETREFSCIEYIGDEPDIEAGDLIYRVKKAIDKYQPFSFWDNKEYFLQMLVEKIDLFSLFKPICQKYYIPIANTKGWSDLNQRYDMMRRFAYWDGEGKICRLLYCGDFDPVGVQISRTLVKNMQDISQAAGWTPDDNIIDRFGLNEDFINQHNLSWIDGLVTGSGKDLADPKHRRHYSDCVQDWLDKYGRRKVEANALVVRPKEGRKLCEGTIRKYVKMSAPKKYQTEVEPYRQDLLNQFKIQIKDL